MVFHTEWMKKLSDAHIRNEKIMNENCTTWFLFTQNAWTKCDKLSCRNEICALWSFLLRIMWKSLETIQSHNDVIKQWRNDDVIQQQWHVNPISWTMSVFSSSHLFLKRKFQKQFLQKMWSEMIANEEQLKIASSVGSLSTTQMRNKTKLTVHKIMTKNEVAGHPSLWTWKVRNEFCRVKISFLRMLAKFLDKNSIWKWTCVITNFVVSFGALFSVKPENNFWC